MSTIFNYAHGTRSPNEVPHVNPASSEYARSLTFPLLEIKAFSRLRVTFSYVFSVTLSYFKSSYRRSRANTVRGGSRFLSASLLELSFSKTLKHVLAIPRSDPSQTKKRAVVSISEPTARLRKKVATLI